MFEVKIDNPHVPKMLNVYRDGKYWGQGETLPNGSVSLPLMNINHEIRHQPFKTIQQYLNLVEKYEGFSKKAAKQYLGV